MDYENYKANYFTSPPPEPKFDFIGIKETAIYFEEYEPVVAFYIEVLGPPAYVEGKYTHSWTLGGSRLTFLKGKNGGPQNVEIVIYMTSPKEAERLQAVFIEAGGKGEPPSDQLMHEPIRYCFVQDPFGTSFLIVSPLSA